MTPVELAPEVTASLRAMKYRGTPPQRCHKGVIQSNILARATDPQISRYTPTHEVKRILINRAGTVENCPTTTQATTTRGDGGCERNNLPPKRTTTPKK